MREVTSTISKKELQIATKRFYLPTGPTTHAKIKVKKLIVIAEFLHTQSNQTKWYWLCFK